jgi:demethoxyubiquinone hydroxylase (CLK1/Coq7/Cat5 family)
MNSNFSKIVCNLLFISAKFPKSAPSDPKETDMDAMRRGPSDTDPDGIVPYVDNEVQSGVRQSWEEVRTTPFYRVRDKFDDAPVFAANVEPFDRDVLSPESLDKLDECLRGELSAVQTYELALQNLEATEISGALRQLRDSHNRRVTLIRDRIRSWGAVPSETSGAWGTFARLIQRGADLFGDKAAISALEEGEDHGLRLYLEDLDDIDLETREFIRHELLPDQRRTHDLCRSLYRFVKAA